MARRGVEALQQVERQPRAAALIHSPNSCGC
jgi:hypothetical protein